MGQPISSYELIEYADSQIGWWEAEKQNRIISLGHAVWNCPISTQSYNLGQVRECCEKIDKFLQAKRVIAELERAITEKS